MDRNEQVLQGADAIERVIQYHERTKHHFHRYARSLGYMDWATQPDPFRRYPGATRIALAHPPLSNEPTYDSLFSGQWQAPNPVNHQTISQFFYESLAISAWKQIAGGEPWSLRINPSSGDLHPTEAYLISGPMEGMHEVPGIYHYCVYEHALERRATLMDEEWSALASQLPAGAFLMALTSIHWRESWKYGERAFRYCQHDVGHAIGALAFSAATLGWQTRLVCGVSDETLSVLVGIAFQQEPEAEHPDCVLVVIPGQTPVWGAPRILQLPIPMVARLRAAVWEGKPNRLSSEHHSWAVIEEASAACIYQGDVHDEPLQPETIKWSLRASAQLEDRHVPARRIIRQRRSAVDMDGVTGLTRDAFYRMMINVTPVLAPFPFAVLPWRARVSLGLFVHRVEGLEAGLYLLVRDAGHEESLRGTVRQSYVWQRPPACPDGLGLYLLSAGDARQAASAISCHQDIAADGAFALGMIAQFESTLREAGAWMYSGLFWECGLIGQVLYLEAEAAGVRATGIGCFFDDPMHELLGITDHSWQSLYHFAVGSAVEDPRLITLPPYAHLQGKA